MKKVTGVVLACLMAAHVGATEDLDAVQVVESSASIDTSSNAVSQADIDEQNALSDASTKDITPKTMDDFFKEFFNSTI